MFLRQAWCGTWSASPRPRGIFGEGDASDTKVVIFKDSKKKKCSGGEKHSLIYYLCKEIDRFTHIPEILIGMTQVRLPLVRKHAHSDGGVLFFSRLLCLPLLFFLPTLCPSSSKFSEGISYIIRQYSLLFVNHWVPWTKWGVDSAQILGIYPTFFPFSSFSVPLILLAISNLDRNTATKYNTCSFQWTSYICLWLCEYKWPITLVTN